MKSINNQNFKFSAFAERNVAMALVINSVYQMYNRLFHEFKGGVQFIFSLIFGPTHVKRWFQFKKFVSFHLDPRNEERGFIGLGSPFPVLAVVAAYVYFVKVLGPKIMKNRDPFDLTRVIYVYNFIQILLNLYIGCVVRFFGKQLF